MNRSAATKTHKVDVRLVLATNRDLEEMVRQGEFREDLYYRINVITVTQPPLRERIGDILAVDRALPGPLQRANGQDDQRIRRARHCGALRRYSWPGNVRELVNVVERSVVLSKGRGITLAELPDAIRREDLARTDVSPCGRVPT